MKKTSLSVCLSLLFSATLLVAAPPVKKSQVLNEMKRELRNNRKYQKTPVKKYFKIKFSGDEKYTTKKRNFRLHPYYILDMHVFCKGAYGQVIRELITVYYIKVGGMWISDGMYWFEKKSKLISGPTKKIARPDKKTIMDILGRALKKANKDSKIEILKFELDENPKFALKGDHFERAAFNYNIGDLEFKIHSKKSKTLRYVGTTIEMYFDHKLNKWRMDLKAKKAEEIK